VFQEGHRVFQSLPLQDVSTTDDATAQVQYTGQLTFAYQDERGNSIAPYGIDDALSPFGNQVALYLTVSVGSFVERVLVGRYLITSTPQINTVWGWFQGKKIAKGETLQVQIGDFFARTQRNQFDNPTSPPSLASCWSEIARLTGLPITRMVADKPIPNTVAYQSDRLSAVYSIATVMDATPFVLPNGSVGARPNDWPDPVDTILGGDGGTLISAPRAMDNQNVYNALIVRDVSGNILASAEVLDGPLRTKNADGSLSPYGRVPYYYSDPQITTPDQALAWVTKYLPHYSTLRGMQVTVTEAINPLRDLGDVVTVKRIASGHAVEQFDGRVQQIQRSGKTQTTTLAVGQ